jgi:tyrosine phenol-lyase
MNFTQIINQQTLIAWQVKMSSEVKYSSAFEIATIRPSPQPNFVERLQVLTKARFNSFCIPQDKVYMDLRTDGSSGALISLQQAAFLELQSLESGYETAPENSPAMTELSQYVEEIFGFPYVVPAGMGRLGERTWINMRTRPGAIVPGNMLFWTVKYYIHSAGGKVEDVVAPGSYELFSEEPFKGNVDLNHLEKFIQDSGPQNIPYMYLELCVNALGGHPISISNLKATKEILTRFNIPLYLDATRILENSELIRRREPGYKDRSIASIIKEICSYADACTMSAQKDFAGRGIGLILMRDSAHYAEACEKTQLEGIHPASAGIAALCKSLPEIVYHDQYGSKRVAEIQRLAEKLNEKNIPILRPSGGHAVFIDLKSFFPHLSYEHFPAQSLAAYVYLISGIRLAKGGSPSPSQKAKGIDLLRVTLPANRYTEGHINDLVSALAAAYEAREKITGLKLIKVPGRPGSFSEPFERPSWIP